MLAKTFKRFSSAADLLRPRTFFRTLSRVDQLADATRELTAKVEELRIQTEQLLTIRRLDAEQQEDLERLPAELDSACIGAHIRQAIAAATLHHDPFPHLVAEQWLPPRVYDIMIQALPPSVFFSDREPSRQRLIVPFGFAPAYSQRVWKYVSQEIIGSSLREALSEKFGPSVHDFLHTFCPSVPEGFEQRMHLSDGRIMLRRPGYVITPHRDPKWGFLTGLVYLAREGDNEAYGTQLYRVRDDEEAPNDKPLYVDERRCELVKSVPFRANTLLVFLNSTGAHGASIPSDATPATLERYVYQFRLGPDGAGIKQLLEAMPEAARGRWSGSKANKARGASGY